MMSFNLFSLDEWGLSRVSLTFLLLRRGNNPFQHCKRKTKDGKMVTPGRDTHKQWLPQFSVIKWRPWLSHALLTNSNVDLLATRQNSCLSSYLSPPGLRVPVLVFRKLETIIWTELPTHLSSIQEIRKRNKWHIKDVSGWDAPKSRVPGGTLAGLHSKAEWVNGWPCSQMHFATRNTVLLFCNVAENKLLTTCPSLAPPIFQIMIYMLGCLCLIKAL